MVFFHHGFYILQILRQLDIHVLAVAQQILALINDPALCSLGKHGVQHLHGLLPACFILGQVTVQSHLEIGRGHDPLLAVLLKEG